MRITIGVVLALVVAGFASPQIVASGEPLTGRLEWTRVNERPAPTEWPAGSGVILVGGFLELADSTPRPGRFTLGFTIRPKGADSARSQSHGGSFRLSSDTIFFTNDGAENLPPVVMRFLLVDNSLRLTDSQGNHWTYARAAR